MIVNSGLVVSMVCYVEILDEILSFVTTIRVDPGHGYLFGLGLRYSR